MQKEYKLKAIEKIKLVLAKYGSSTNLGKYEDRDIIAQEIWESLYPENSLPSVNNKKFVKEQMEKFDKLIVDMKKWLLLSDKMKNIEKDEDYFEDDDMQLGASIVKSNDEVSGVFMSHGKIQSIDYFEDEEE